MFTTVTHNIPATMTPLEHTTRQSLGDHLYQLVDSNLIAGRNTMIENNLWTPNMTTSKIVGMMLEGLNQNELVRACSDSPYLAEIMVDACEILMVAAGRQPFCA
jgi:hypothetical protein